MLSDCYCEAMGTRRGRTLSGKRLTRDEIEAGKLLETPLDVSMPKTRGDCVDGHRPCPWVRCKYHLYVDVAAGEARITINFPQIDPDEMDDSCSLDIADLGGQTLEEVGLRLGITRERTRQIEVIAKEKVLLGELCADLVRTGAEWFGET